ncbi:crocetin glucosyltransferase 3 [Oryza sativa Japonica Group]|uniref:crocetin glucosyltransferase 3 n=1 Tax=Oryza sativa subsp. japonica TaxID=39947 RepID=UPI00339C912A
MVFLGEKGLYDGSTTFKGQGHLAGFLALARLLRRDALLPDGDVDVTLVCTPRNGATLRASDDDDDDGADLPLREFITLLFEAFESLEPAFDGFLSGLVDQEGTTVCVVADGFVAWTVGVARRRGCPRTRSSCRAARSARPSSSETTTSEHDAVLSWLDTQRPASVLYISFGSQNSIRLHQTTKSSRRRWSPAAVRSSGPSARRWGSTCINGQFRDEWLPEGFEQRARGHVVHGWAPRVSILAHA